MNHVLRLKASTHARLEASALCAIEKELPMSSRMTNRKLNPTRGQEANPNPGCEWSPNHGEVQNLITVGTEIFHRSRSGKPQHGRRMKLANTTQSRRKVLSAGTPLN